MKAHIQSPCTEQKEQPDLVDKERTDTADNDNGGVLYRYSLPKHLLKNRVFLDNQREAQGNEKTKPSCQNGVPSNPNERKQSPIYEGFLKYFPDAVVAVAECSYFGNLQHNPDKPLFWDRTKSQDEKDALVRHLMEAGTIDTDGIRHSTKVAWRALANLQKEIEESKRGY